MATSSPSAPVLVRSSSGTFEPVIFWSQQCFQKGGWHLTPPVARHTRRRILRLKRRVIRRRSTLTAMIKAAPGYLLEGGPCKEISMEATLHCGSDSNFEAGAQEGPQMKHENVAKFRQTGWKRDNEIMDIHKLDKIDETWI